MTPAQESLLAEVAKSGVKSVRVVFVDQHGITRGKTIMASGLKSALKNGVSMTSTLLLKDTSHRTVFPVWDADAGFGTGVMTGASDFLMMPDASTYKILPWAPDTGWILSDILHTDGREIAFSTRAILQKALARLEQQGLRFVTGLEVEFHVLQVDTPSLSHADADWPQTPPETRLISHGHQYLTESRIDTMAPIMDQIRDNALALGLPIRTMESEFGPSQFEVTFEPCSGITSADNMILFRNMVKQTCARQGLHATFMCRPQFKNAMGSGWHLHQSLVDQAGNNLFMPAQGEKLSPMGEHWIAGLLKHAAASCLLSTPTINGYKRYQPFSLAPDRIQWGFDNRGAMLRVLARAGDPASRVENRIGEPAANPYLYLASQVLAGLDGIENHLSAPAPVENPYASDAPLLPASFIEALHEFESSRFYQQALGKEFVTYLSHIKHAEWQRFLSVVSDWEQREYFSAF